MPRRTVWLIDKLVELGLTNSTFVFLHHLGTSIWDHRRYCNEDISTFTSRTNHDVRNRLDYIYQEIQHRGFSVPLPEGLLETLAHEATERYPMRGDSDVGHICRAPSHEKLTHLDSVVGSPRAGHLDEEILAAYMEGFFGYGNLNGDYWFIGMEEGGGNSFEEIERRLACWNERGRKTLEDLRQYHEAFGEQRWFLLRKIQPTWGRLIRILLSATGQPHEDQDVRSYQVDKLGRDADETCLMELMPLPSQSTDHWHYGSWSKLPDLQSRERYYAALAAPRLKKIKQLIAEYQPKVVVFYGRSYQKIWMAACPKGITFRSFQIADMEVSIADQRGSTYTLCAHPASRGSSNRYFDAVGRKIRDIANGP
jgi:hypothetical protein